MLAAWATLQLTWVTMLLAVQFVQISRAKTTYESMRGRTEHSSRASEALTAALTSGSTSMAGAQLLHSSMPHGHSHPHHHEGCFAQWKKLLGLDTFLATAQDGLESGSRRRRGRHAFSRGIVTNCRDFWCDPAPVFGKRELGDAMLDGKVVNYARMYEVPPRMRRRGAEEEGGVYSSVAGEVV